MYFTYQQNPTTRQWHWNLKSANHEIVAQGETYINERDCLHAIDLVRGTTQDTPVRKL